jgi:hypothetical protein
MIWYSSKKPGLWPAKRQKIERTSAAHAHSKGKSVEMRILALIDTETGICDGTKVKYYHRSRTFKLTPRVLINTRM